MKVSRLDPRSNFSQLDNDVLLNSAEASSVLSVSINTLKSWKKDDKGPPTVKLGRSVRYAAGDLRNGSPRAADLHKQARNHVRRIRR